MLCVDGLAMTVDRETGRAVRRWFLVGLRLEDAGCPFLKGIGEGLRSSCTGQLGKKARDVSISVRTLSPGEHTESASPLYARKSQVRRNPTALRKSSVSKSMRREGEERCAKRG